MQAVKDHSATNGKRARKNKTTNTIKHTLSMQMETEKTDAIKATHEPIAVTITYAVESARRERNFFITQFFKGLALCGTITNPYNEPPHTIVRGAKKTFLS